MRKVGFITGIFLYCLLFIFILPKYMVIAAELNEKVAEIKDEIDDYDIEAVEEEEPEVLIDTYENISDYENNDDSEEVVEDVEENNMEDKTPYELVVVFSFGLLSGILLGNFLTGFIK